MTSGTLRDLTRALAVALARPPVGGAPIEPIDLSGMVTEPPRMRDCPVVEGARFEARPVTSPPVVGFAAFLDGTQSSHVADFAGTIPLVAGRTAAVVRSRVDRRMTTWGPGARHSVRLYVPLQLLPAHTRRELERLVEHVRDTLPPSEEVAVHPFELMRRAVDAVKDDRETLERELAEDWTGTMTAPLFVDGGLPSGPLASASRWCVGVVKSHHTIYAPGDGLAAALGLPVESRTTAFLVERTWGPRVISWYLRLREPPTRDPFLGLVRVEIAWLPELDGPDAISARADMVSRWILAERSPLSLPDARWDRMVYGVRDCEEYLRATMG